MPNGGASDGREQTAETQAGPVEATGWNRTAARSRDGTGQEAAARPSRPNFRSRSQARTWFVMSDPTARGMSGQCVAIRLQFTSLQATPSRGP